MKDKHYRRYIAVGVTLINLDGIQFSRIRMSSLTRGTLTINSFIISLAEIRTLVLVRGFQFLPFYQL